MDPTEYLAASLGIFIGLSFLIICPQLISSRARSFLRTQLRKHILYPHIRLPLNVFPAIRRLDAAAVILLLVGNICATTISAKDLSESTMRLGHVAVIHLILLTVGAHMHPVISRLGISYRRLNTCHALTGILVILATATHTILGLHQTRSELRMSDSRTMGGVIVSFSPSLFFYVINTNRGAKAAAAMALMCVSSALFSCRWLFDVISILHTSLALLALVSLWLHVTHGSIWRPPRLYLLLVSICLFLSKVCRIISTVWTSWNSHVTITSSSHHEGVELRLHMNRSVAVHAGQYVYVCIPGLSVLSLFRYHPFQVSWVHEDEDGGQVLVLLVQPRRGFTRSLLLARPFYRYKVMIEGPCGSRIEMSQYGTVLLFAANIGISSFLLLMKELLQLRDQGRACTRRIALFWEVDAEGELQI